MKKPKSVRYAGYLLWGFIALMFGEVIIDIFKGESTWTKLLDLVPGSLLMAGFYYLILRGGNISRYVYFFFETTLFAYGALTLSFTEFFGGIYGTAHIACRILVLVLLFHNSSDPWFGETAAGSFKLKTPRR